MSKTPQRRMRARRPVRPGRVRALRLAAGLTQQALATHSGVSAQMIWLIDNDHRQPSLALLRKLKQVLAHLPERCSPDPPGAAALAVVTAEDSAPGAPARRGGCLEAE